MGKEAQMLLLKEVILSHMQVIVNTRAYDTILSTCTFGSPPGPFFSFTSCFFSSHSRAGLSRRTGLTATDPLLVVLSSHFSQFRSLIALVVAPHPSLHLMLRRAGLHVKENFKTRWVPAARLAAMDLCFCALFVHTCVLPLLSPQPTAPVVMSACGACQHCRINNRNNGTPGQRKPCLLNVDGPSAVNEPASPPSLSSPSPSSVANALTKWPRTPASLAKPREEGTTGENINCNSCGAPVAITSSLYAHKANLLGQALCNSCRVLRRDIPLADALSESSSNDPNVPEAVQSALSSSLDAGGSGSSPLGAGAGVGTNGSVNAVRIVNVRRCRGIFNHIFQDSTKGYNNCIGILDRPSTVPGDLAANTVKYLKEENKMSMKHQQGKPPMMRQTRGIGTAYFSYIKDNNSEETRIVCVPADSITITTIASIQPLEEESKNAAKKTDILFPISDDWYNLEESKKRLMPKYERVYKLWQTAASYLVSPAEFPSRLVRTSTENAVQCVNFSITLGIAMGKYAKKGFNFLIGGSDDDGKKKK